MRIGLDLDNTLVCYDELFLDEARNLKMIPATWNGGKQAIRARLMSQTGGSRNWQLLQGRVYGPRMRDASLFPGVARFLIRCRLRGDQLFVVSHKTRYGHFDNTRTPLREAASHWMSSKGFFDASRFGLSESNVYFCETRKEKIEKIDELELDVFVDDLVEVFTEKEFPQIDRVLFDSQSDTPGAITRCTTWAEIEKVVLGTADSKEIAARAQEICSEKITEIEPHVGQGNSQIFRILTAKNHQFALKVYPNLVHDTRPRLVTETSAYELLKKSGWTPQVVAADEEMNIALFEWIDGVPISTVTDSLIDQCLLFSAYLKKVYCRVGHGHAPASEACLSRLACAGQIEERIKKLRLIENHELRYALDTVIVPLSNETMAWSERNWPGSDSVETLRENQQTLSPSDFGLHNALKVADGSVRFLDFEYFGRDDPVKLAADFAWHPAMSLSRAHKRRWITGVLALFGDTDTVRQRFRAAWPLFGIRWALILLNEYLDDGWKKRRNARATLQGQRERYQKQQLEKSLKFCEVLRVEGMECPYV